MRTDRELPSKRSGFLRRALGNYFEPVFRFHFWATQKLTRKTEYAALFLDDSSQHVLKLWWAEHVGTPLHSNVKAHHVTLIYNPSYHQRKLVKTGSSGSVQITGYAEDERGQAVLVVELGGMLLSRNQHPHITMAVADGVNPVYSNGLLAKGYVRTVGPILSGVVDVRDD